jgi:hypothetical protein
MSTSEFIASLMGPTLIAIALSVLINRGRYTEMIAQVERNYSIVFFAGIVMLVAGLAVVQTHNIWQGWPVIVTILGWLLIIGGIIRTLFAPRISTIARPFVEQPMLVLLALLVALSIGAFLTMKGYGLI